ncbi:MAG: multidrug transporter [Ignavibacteriae bacterium]|nr:multidrug transporter [Ignavibacteriota bacterium]
MSKSKGNSGSKARSAISGKYVTKGYAKSHPKTTVLESSKKKK